MANNLRKEPDINGIFISKDGGLNDGDAVVYTGSNLQLAKDTPQNAFPVDNRFQGIKNIIGSGYYSPSAPLQNFILEADGRVVIDMNNSILGGRGEFLGIEFRNFVVNQASDRSVRTFNNCTLRNGSTTASVATNYNLVLNNCLVFSQSNTEYLRVGLTGGGTPAVLINNTWYNSTPTYTVINGCRKSAHINPDLGVCVRILDPTRVNLFEECCFYGQIDIGGTIYSSFSDPQLAIDYPNFVNNQNNFEITQDLDDCFNNRQQFDFSLKITSQFIRTGFTIGALPFMFAVYSGVDPEGTQGTGAISTPPNSFVGIENIRLAGGVNEAIYTWDWVRADPINNSEVQILIDDLVNQFSFDSDLNSSQPNNENVPKTNDYSDGTQGANPRRPTYEFRTSSSVTKPTTDAQADNSFLITAGDWINHEANFERLELDNLRRPKGDLDYNPEINQLVFRCVWIQRRVRLKSFL